MRATKSMSMTSIATFLFLLISFVVPVHPKATTTATHIDPGFNITAVLALAQSLPSHSWEFGTASEALLELFNPSLSVFGDAPFPIPHIAQGEVRALTYAREKIKFGDAPSVLVDGGGAVGDPASLGVSAILIGWGEGTSSYKNAAEKEMDYLLNGAPRWSNGAISHRSEEAELWADFVYMAPPFMAYYAAVKSNISIFKTTVTQCGLYRAALRLVAPPSDPPTKGLCPRGTGTGAPPANATNGLWTHILGPPKQDRGVWSTGNGWAAAGMVRVLATVMRAPIADTPANVVWRTVAIQQLGGWVKEILEGAMVAGMDGGLLRNYLLDKSGDGHGFGETSGSAMLAATAYRARLLLPEVFGKQFVSWADGIRGALGKDGHVEDGRVVPAVNPLDWNDVKPYLRGSPEGQSFVVLMYAAWRDCKNAGLC